MTMNYGVAHAAGKSRYTYVNRRIIYVVLPVIMLFGVLVRLDFQAIQSDKYVITNLDGYYYLILAERVSSKVYSSRETLLAYPDLPDKSDIPPLLSMVTAVISAVTGLSLIQAAALLPPVLGVLICVPIYYVSRSAFTRNTAIYISFFSIIIPSYLYRSKQGWFDTDVLNIFFPLLLVSLSIYISNKFTLSRGMLFSILYVCVAYLYFLWWDQAPYVVIVFALFPLCSIIIFNCRDNKKLIHVAISMALVMVIYPGQLSDLYASMLSVFSYINKSDASLYPGIGHVIREQKPLGIKNFMELSTASWILLILAPLGLTYLIRKNLLIFVLMIPFLTLGIFALFFANRFLIFMVPILAIGLGYAVYLIGMLAPKKTKMPLTIISLIVFSGSILASVDRGMHKPIIPREIVNSMSELEHVTADKSVIWATCDFGYPISFLANRATICDGSTHSGERMLISSLPFAFHTPYQTARFIMFYVTRGRAGFNEVRAIFDGDLDRTRKFFYDIYYSDGIDYHDIIYKHYPEVIVKFNGANNIDAFFFPKHTVPTYLYLDYKSMQIMHWIYWFSTWNQEANRGIQPQYAVIHNVSRDGNILSDPAELFWADLGSGNALMLGRLIPFVKSYILYSHDESYEYSNKGNLVLEYSPHLKLVAIAEPRVQRTMAHQLFFDKIRSPYLKPVYSSGSAVKVFEISLVE